MSKLCKALAIIVLVAIVGCSHSVDKDEVENIEQATGNFSFTGTIKEINGNSAIVYGTLGGGEGNVIVDLSVNHDEMFQVKDKVKVKYAGIIMYSNPAQITTLSVELIE